MKNILVLFAAVAALSSALFFQGCKKDDTTPARLTMAGYSPMVIYLNAPFNDPGVTASDNEDGVIAVTSNVSTTNPDVNKTGTYYIDYSATDNAGNKSSVSRTVVVKNQAEPFSHSYYVTGTCASGWTDGIIASTTVNNRITFTEFGRYTNANGKLSADIDLASLSVTIVPATIFCGTVPVNRSFSGGGAISFALDSILLSVTEITPTDTTICDYYYARH